MVTSPVINSSFPTNMKVAPSSLSATDQEILSRCPRFRILIVGNTGVGKSSLIANIFNVSQGDIDIADGRAGIADIDREYTSTDYPRIALHDTKGFEIGSSDHCRAIEKFIRQRSKRSLPVEQRLHALWLCIESPRSGSRLMQTADEDLLRLASHRNIPVIIVFTKFDLLFNEFYFKAARDQRGQHNHRRVDQNRVAEDARSSLRASVEMFQQQFNLLKPKGFPWIPKQPIRYVGVSTNHQFFDSWRTLEELTRVTGNCLHAKEKFSAWAAVTQRICPKRQSSSSSLNAF